MRSPRPARSSARFAVCSHAWRVLSSQSPALAARDFRAPPFSGAIPPIRPAIYFYDTEGAPVSAESVVDITGDLAVQEDGGLTVLTDMEPLEGIRQIGAILHAKAVSTPAGRVCD